MLFSIVEGVIYTSTLDTIVRNCCCLASQSSTLIRRYGCWRLAFSLNILRCLVLFRFTACNSSDRPSVIRSHQASRMEKTCSGWCIGVLCYSKLWKFHIDTKMLELNDIGKESISNPYNSAYSLLNVSLAWLFWYPMAWASRSTRYLQEHTADI